MKTCRLSLASILVAWGLLGVSQALADSNPEQHKLGPANDLSDLKPAEDPSSDVSLSVCGPGLTDDFKAGFRIGFLRARQGKREWIRPIDPSIDPLSVKVLQGCREMILQQYRFTKALDDQIEGFNQAMWGAVIEDIKKSEQAVAPNRSLPPTQKSASPVRGSED